MPSGKHRTSRSKPVPKPAPAPTPERRDDADRTVERRLGELAEAVNIMIPELSARVAALEHEDARPPLGHRPGEGGSPEAPADGHDVEGPLGHASTRLSAWGGEVTRLAAGGAAGA